MKTFMNGHMPYTCMIFCNFVYAGMVMISKVTIAKGTNPYVFGVYRQAFATLALAPFAYFYERKNAAPLGFNLLCKIFAISFIGITLSINLLNLALSYIPATFVTATANAIPAMTFLMAVCFRMESLSLTQKHGLAKLLGSVLCISGALVYGFLKGPPIATSDSGNSHPSTGCKSKQDCIKGFLIIISAQAAWSLWMIMQGPIVKEYPDKLRLTTIQCFFGCMQSIVWAVIVDRDMSTWKLGWDVNLLAVIYCGVVFTGVTYWLRVWAIEKKGPVFAAVFTPLALVITAIFSAILWKEYPRWGSLCGALLLVLGLYGVLWGKHQEDNPKLVELVKSESKGGVLWDKHEEENTKPVEKIKSESKVETV